MQNLVKSVGARATLIGFAGIFLFSTLDEAIAASFQISPTRFEFSLKKRFTDFFTLTNNSSENLRIRAFPSFLDVNENNVLVPVEGHPLDLSRYVVINPRKFSLRPGQKRVVRFSVRPPPQLTAGEYRVVIFFAELPGFSGRPAPQEPQPTQGLGTVRIKLLTRLGITLYGMKGEKHPDAALETASAAIDETGVVIEGKVVNTGNVHIPLTLAARIVNRQGKEVEAGTTRLVIQREQWRGFKINLPKPPSGDNRVILSGSQGDQVFFESEIPLRLGPS